MIYAATIFLSSFLLFLVQPLIARLILPWFGGSAAVWTTCMLFFQALLLAGYGYAHLLEKKLGRGRLQPIIHTALLAAAVATLPISPSEAWKPGGDEEPISRILLLLGASVGLPYLLVASTSPLLQAWFARARPGENPYRLFAISNLASLVALVGYPFVVEPFLAAHEQVSLWSWLFAAFAILCAVVAWRTPRAGVGVETAPVAAPVARQQVGLWLALSATGSVLLLATTNHLTQNVASIPLLWLAPLTLYLLTFIIAFEGRNWYRPQLVWPFVLAWLGGMAWLLVDSDYHYNLALQLGMFLPGLFLGCLFCHGELYRLRPEPRQLTKFYLIVSAGGALGGLFVAVVAPLAFDGYYELGIGMTVLALLAAMRFAQLGRFQSLAGLGVLMGVAACAAYDAFYYHARRARVRARVLRRVAGEGVRLPGRAGAPAPPGARHDHAWRAVPRTAPVHHHATTRKPRASASRSSRARGAGRSASASSAWAREPSRLTAGPATSIASTTSTRAWCSSRGSEFSFLADSPAKVEVALGDARLTLEREPPQNFDVLAVDAFSSDAIPVHLITREALGIYLRHVKSDGIVAFHVSNRFLDLIPVVARIAKEQGAHAVLVNDDPDDEDDSLRSRSDWVLVSRDPAALEREPIVEGGGQAAEDRPRWRTWTDDYSNLIQILK